MLYSGPPLRTQVLEETTIWQWLFENRTYSALKTTGPSTGGFRDAETGDFLSYEQVQEHASHTSTSLASALGINPGDNVAIVARNSIWYPVALFAAVRLGATVSPLPPGSSAKELSYFLAKASSKAIFADASNYPAVIEACRAEGIPTSSVISLKGETQGGLSLQDLISRGKRSGQLDAYRAPRTESNGAICAFMCFSSGTTGFPKAVMISHRNVISQLVQMCELEPDLSMKVLLGVLPFYHITGLVQILHLPVLLDQEVIVMEQFTMTTMLQAITSYGCQELWVVPPLLIRLVNDEEVVSFDLSCVKQFNTGAAPLSTEIVAKLAEKFPSVRMRQAWGMTESCGCITVTPKGLMKYENAYAVGKLIPGTAMKLVDPESGKELSTGEVGELLIRGPQVTLGYAGNLEATQATFDSEGFLHTGDLGSINQEGFITIHDRLKEMIKVKGNGVAPAEIEDVLLGHPAVKDAAVVGLADDYSGEVPMAFVVVGDGVQQGPETEKVLQEYVKGQKVRYKWLTGGVEFVDEIPKSASGKILRRLLRDRANASRKNVKARL